MSKNPDFTKIAFETPKTKASMKDWKADIEKKTAKASTTSSWKQWSRFP